MAFCLSAFSLGMVVGPAIGGKKKIVILQNKCLKGELNKFFFFFFNL